MGLKGWRVLVTGGGGFIGSHLLQMLVRGGAQVKAFIRYNSSNSKGLIDTLPMHERQEIETIAGDLRDFHAVREAVRGSDVVFHLGALVAIPYSYRHPVDVFHTNILGTLHVAQAVRDEGQTVLVHTSTSETYGSAQTIPMPESHPLQGQSPYAASKIGADKIVESYHRAYGFPAITLRPFNAFGPRQSMRAVIPTIIQQALFGNKIRLGNLRATRDFTYVTDTVRAFVCAAATALSGNNWGETYNAGSGRETAIEELAEQIKRLTGRDIPLEIDSRRLRPDKSEVDRLFSDSSKAARELGWQPRISLDDGLLETIAWIRRFPRKQVDEYVT